MIWYDTFLVPCDLSISLCPCCEACLVQGMPCLWLAFSFSASSDTQTFHTNTQRPQASKSTQSCPMFM